MKPPLLTVVTITKDDPAGLARTLASTGRLRACEWVEQIVIDGGGTSAFVADDGVRVVRQASSGIAEAFNEGAAAARGEWLWFLNGGDAAHEDLDPEWLRGWLGRTRADIATGGLHYDGQTEPSMPPALHDQTLARGCWPFHPATFVRRGLLDRAGGFDRGFGVAMDFDFWFKALGLGAKVDVAALPLARFARGGRSEAPAFRARLEQERARLLWRHRRLLIRDAARLAWRTAGALTGALWGLATGARRTGGSEP